MRPRRCAYPWGPLRGWREQEEEPEGARLPPRPAGRPLACSAGPRLAAGGGRGGGGGGGGGGRLCSLQGSRYEAVRRLHRRSGGMVFAGLRAGDAGGGSAGGLGSGSELEDKMAAALRSPASSSSSPLSALPLAASSSAVSSSSSSCSSTSERRGAGPLSRSSGGG